jgi:hypothetical protein
LSTVCECSCCVGFWRGYYLILNTPPPRQTYGRNDQKFVTQEAEAVGSEAFGEEVSNLIKGGEVAELDVFVEDFFPDEMNVHLDMLCESM